MSQERDEKCRVIKARMAVNKKEQRVVSNRFWLLLKYAAYLLAMFTLHV
jgi:hypothetical protein